MIAIEFACFPPGFPNLFACSCQDILVVGVLPLYEVFYDLEEPLPFFGCLHFVYAAVEVPLVTGVIYQLSK